MDYGDSKVIQGNPAYSPKAAIGILLKGNILYKMLKSRYSGDSSVQGVNTVKNKGREDAQGPYPGERQP